MTQAQRHAVGTALDATVKIVTLIGGVLIIAGSLWAMTAWATGGLKPQIQVASDALSDKVATIQGDIASIKQRLDQLPGAYEISSQRTHFDKLDERISAVEKLESNHEGRITGLEHPQWRQPH